MQAQLNHILGLHRTNSSVSIDSITSFAGSTHTKKAYKEFCRSLFQIGVTSEMLRQKNTDILNIFRPQNAALFNSQMDDSNIVGQSQLPPVSNFPSLKLKFSSVLVDKEYTNLK